MSVEMRKSKLFGSNGQCVVRWRFFFTVAALAAALSLTAGPAQAQLDAYSIQVAVLDRSDEEQQDAYQLGMRSVLLRNSGDKTLLNRDEVRAGLRQADSYVEAFRYDTPEPGTVISRDTPLTDRVRSTGKATQLMLIQFNRELIDGLIRPAKRPEPEPQEGVDPFNRVSAALMWLMVEDGDQQMLISAARGQNVMERAREIAGGAGIILNFPAGDTKDEQALRAEDIKTAAADRVAAAAGRYAQPLTLAAHVSRTLTGNWEGVWMKVAAGQQQNQAFSSTSLDTALQQGIAWLGQNAGGTSSAPSTFRSSSSANASSAEGLVWVSPLRTTQSYAQVMRFLTGLDGVDVAYPKEVLSGGVVFAIMPRGAVPIVANAANSQDWIRQSTTPSSASESRFADGITAALEYLR